MVVGKRRPRRGLALAGGGLLLLALLVHSFYTNPEWRSFRWDRFGQALLAVDPAWSAGALVSIYATYLVRALRWRVLMAPAKPDARLWNLFSATVIGFAAIGVLGRAGEMVRPYLVARKEGVPLPGQLAIWLVERAFDTLTVLVTVAFALRSFHGAAWEARPLFAQWIRTAGSIVAFTTIALLVLLVALRNLAGPLVIWVQGWLRLRSPQQLSPARRARIEEALEAFVDGTRGIRELPVLGKCIAYSLLEWVLVAFCYRAVFSSFSGGLRLSLTETLVFMGAVMAGSMVNLPGVGGGIQVASLLVLTEVFGLRPEPAASVALLIWAFTFLVVIPPALILMVREGLNWGKLRRLDSET